MLRGAGEEASLVPNMRVEFPDVEMLRNMQTFVAQYEV